MSDTKIVGQIRMLPKDTIIWSVTNQTTFKLYHDEVILITHTCWGTTTVFCKPQLAFGWITNGVDEKWINKGKDEWSVDYNQTVENTQELRKGILLVDMVYSDEIKNKEDGK